MITARDRDIAKLTQECVLKGDEVSEIYDAVSSLYSEQCEKLTHSRYLITRFVKTGINPLTLFYRFKLIGVESTAVVKAILVGREIDENRSV